MPPKMFLWLGIVILLLGGLFFWSKFKNPIGAPVEVLGFTDCLLQSGAIMESYPRQCRAKDGQVFTESLSNEVEKMNLIRLSYPRPNDFVKSPLIISGEARGYWFFEASFPVYVVDWDGRIIGQGIAQAGGEWMTEEFVPFETKIEFVKPEIANTTDFGKRGSIILQKDNPSGLPENDDALEVPILFE